MTRVVYSFGQDITTEHTFFRYVSFIHCFAGYSTQYFMNIIRIFGPHAALYIDNVLICIAAEGVTSILKTCQALAGDIGKVTLKLSVQLLSPSPAAFSCIRERCQRNNTWAE
jgi:hypothetical protein